MNWVLRTAALLACGLLLASIPPTAAQEKSDIAADKASAWMKQKLELSQNILTGLTHGDFEQVEINAQRMNVVNYLEKGIASDKPQYEEYRRQLNYFTLANREILRQAKAKNIERRDARVQPTHRQLRAVPSGRSRREEEMTEGRSR